MAGSLGRLLGLGFLFGAKDDGAVRTTEAIQRGFEGISSTVQRVGSSGSASIQRFGNAISALNLGAITRANSAISDLAQSSGLLQGGDTSMESFGAQAHQAFRQATAGMGEFRGEMEQYRSAISGQAFNLGVDVGELTTGIAAIVRTGHSLDDYGLSVRDLAGLSQAGIIDANALAQSLTSLSEGYGLGAEGAGRLVDGMTAMGTAGGFGMAAVSNLEAAIAAADSAISALPPGVEASVDDTLMSLTRLATGTAQELGVAFDMDGAVATLNVLAGARQELSDVFSGNAAEFPQLAIQLTEAFGSMDQGLDAMLQNPADFVSEMQGVWDTLEEGTEQNRFTSQVLRRFPENMRFMIQAGASGQETLAGLADAAEGSEGALSDMARSASGSARTFDEALGLVQEGFQSRLNRMASGGLEHDVIQRQREMYSRLGDSISHLSDQHGPINSVQGAMGALTRTMLDMRRGGVTGLTIALQRELGEAFPHLSARAEELASTLEDRLEASFPGLGARVRDLIPGLAEMGGSMFEMAQQSGPMILAMSQMQGRIPMLGSAMGLLFNPITLVVGGLILLVRYWDTLGPILQRAGGMFRDLTANILSHVADVDWEQLGTDVIEGILSVFGFAAQSAQTKEMGETAQVFAEGFRNLFDATWRIVSGIAVGMWDRLIDFIFEPDNLTQSVQRGAGVAGVAFGAAMLTPLRGPIIRAGMGLFRGLFRVFQAGGGRLAGAGLRGVLTKIPFVGAIIGVLFDLPDIIDSFQTDGISGGLNRLFRSVVNGLLLGIPDMLEEFLGFDFISDIFDFMFEATNLGNISRAIEDGDWGRAIFEGLFSVFNAAFYGIPGVIRAGLAEVLGFDLLGGFWEEVLAPTLSDLVDFWNDEVNPIITEAIILFSDLADIAIEFWEDAMEPVLSDVRDYFIEVFQETILPAVSRVWDGISIGFRRMWRRVLRPGLIAMARAFISFASESRQSSIAMFRDIAESGVRAFHAIVGGIERMIIVWRQGRIILREGWEAIAVHIRTTIGQAVEYVSFHFTNMLSGFESAMLRIERGFRQLPLAIMTFFRDTLMGDSVMARGIRAVMDTMGISIGSVDRQMNDSIANLERNVATVDQAMSDIDTATRRRERAHAEAVEGFERRRRESVEATSNAYVRMDQMLAASRANHARDLESQLAGIESFSAGAINVVSRLEDRLQNFVTGVASGEFADAAQNRQLEERFASARPVIDALTNAAASGSISPEAYERQVSAIESAIRGGEEFTAEQGQGILRAAGISDGPATEQSARPRASASSRRRSSPVTPQHAGGPAEAARTAARVEAQVQDTQTRAELQRVSIQEISAEAARAIARAAGNGNRTTATPDAVTARRGGRRGSGPNTGSFVPGF